MSGRTVYQAELPPKYPFRDSIMFKEHEDFPLSLDHDVKPDTRTVNDVKATTLFQEIKRENLVNNMKMKVELSNEDIIFEPEYHHSFKHTIVFKQDLEDLYENHSFQEEITIGPEIIQRAVDLRVINEENVIFNKASKSINKTHKRVYKCSCGKSFCFKKGFDKHSCMNVFTCNHCEKHFNTKAHISKHMKIHLKQQQKKNSLNPLVVSINHKRSPYNQECKRCRKKFGLKASLKKHMKTHDNPHIVQEVHKCDICGKVYTLINNLKHHLKIHLGTAKIFKCDKCSNTYKRNEYLQYHYISKHSDGDMNLQTGVVTCRYCSKTHSDRSNRNRHERLYCLSNPHRKGIKTAMTCDICQKTYHHKQSLIDHMMLHMDKKRKEKAPVECELCFQKFTRKFSLKLHMQSKHLNVKNYCCSYCKKGFTRKWSLTCHRKICLPQVSSQSSSAY